MSISYNSCWWEVSENRACHDCQFLLRTNTVLRTVAKKLDLYRLLLEYYSRTTDLVARNVAMRERGHVYRVSFCTCLLREKKNTCEERKIPVMAHMIVNDYELPKEYDYPLQLFKMNSNCCKSERTCHLVLKRWKLISLKRRSLPSEN